MPQFEQSSVFTSLMFWSVISFVLLLFLLKKYAFPPILQILEEREAKIRADIENAERLNQEAEKRKVEFEEQLKTAHEKANTIVQLAHEEAKSQSAKLLQETDGKVKQMLKEAEQEIQTSRNRLFADIRSFAAELTIASTEKILRKTLDDSARKQLVDESIEEVIKELGSRNPN